MIKIRLIIIFFSLFFFFRQNAQVIDTSKVIRFNDTLAPKFDKKKTYTKPRIATIMSICLPGLGQAYNKKFWKIPVIYAGFAGFGYIFYTNNSRYHDFRNAVILSQETSSNGYAVVDGRNWTTDQLQTEKLEYKKLRDVGIIGMGIIYLLNIVDANVDAHLKTFDVSDDLSIRMDPWQTYHPSAKGKTVYGLSVKINFK